jgi:hypothetical protein
VRRDLVRCFRSDGGDEDATDDSERLLADMRTVFGDAEALQTVTLARALCALEEAPWGDRWGELIDSGRTDTVGRRIGLLLKPFRGLGVVSENVLVNGKQHKGYRREVLEEAWTRYCPDRSVPPQEASESAPVPPPQVQPVQSVQTQAPRGFQHEKQPVHKEVLDGSENERKLLQDRGLDALDAYKPERGQ